MITEGARICHSKQLVRPLERWPDPQELAGIGVRDAELIFSYDTRVRSGAAGRATIVSLPDGFMPQGLVRALMRSRPGLLTFA